MSEVPLYDHTTIASRPKRPYRPERQKDIADILSTHNVLFPQTEGHPFIQTRKQPSFQEKRRSLLT